VINRWYISTVHYLTFCIKASCFLPRMWSRDDIQWLQHQGLGSVKIGRYLCPQCGKSLEEDLSFWEEFKAEFFGENLIHQLYLMHLNKRIVQDFPRKPTIEQLMTMSDCVKTQFCKFPTPFFDLKGIYCSFSIQICVFTQPDVPTTEHILQL